MDNADHEHARAAFRQLEQESRITHNYVVVESTALVQRRLGSLLTRALLEDLVPVLDVVWVDEGLHRAAASAFLATLRRKTSFVDAVSFELMRRRGIETAFAFDRHFAAEGFRVIP